MHHTMVALAAFVMPTHTGTEALALILRWFHLMAGITWVGLLYFFNLVNVPFMKQVDAGMKPKIFQYMTMPALQLFRWSALLTVFVGFWYWSQIYVGADADRMGVSAGSTIGLFLLIWIAAGRFSSSSLRKRRADTFSARSLRWWQLPRAWLFVNSRPSARTITTCSPSALVAVSASSCCSMFGASSGRN